MGKCIDCYEQTPDDGYQEICNDCYEKLIVVNEKLNLRIIRLKEALDALIISSHEYHQGAFVECDYCQETAKEIGNIKHHDSCLLGKAADAMKGKNET
jgi:hypothetical protein